MWSYFLLRIEAINNSWDFWSLCPENMFSRYLGYHNLFDLLPFSGYLLSVFSLVLHLWAPIPGVPQDSVLQLLLFTVYTCTLGNFIQMIAVHTVYMVMDFQICISNPGFFPKFQKFLFDMDVY